MAKAIPPISKKTKSIRVRLTEEQYNFLKSFGYNISDVIRKLIDAYMILERIPFFDAVMPLDDLKNKFKKKRS